MTADVLAVRLDSDGDVLLTGPAVRLLAAGAAARGGRVDVLASSAGRAAAALLPDVRDVLVFDAPWSGYAPPPLDRDDVLALVDTLAARRYALAVIFTSFHQSPLPMALLARLAGVGRVVGTSEDYPGSLLDVRHRRPDGLHEVQAALDVARAAGLPAPPTSVAADPDAGPGSTIDTEPDAPGDATRLRVREPLPDVTGLVPADPYVVVHPGASVPARAPAPDHARAVVAALADAGHRVVVTGGPAERDLAAHVAADRATDLAGRTDLAGLAGVLAGARCVVVGNTGPGHLAAAVGTPVVSLFAPVVPAERWAPWGVPTVVLGDQGAPCRGTRARACPVPGHPCLTGVRPEDVVAAVEHLAAGRPGRTAPALAREPETVEVVA